MTPDLSYLDLLIVSTLVVASVVLTAIERLGLGRDIVISCFRAFVQLTAVGWVLGLLFRNVEFHWVALAVLVMIVAAVHAGRGRVGLDTPGLTRDMGLAITLTSVATLAFVVGLVVRPATWYEPQIIIPLAGMIVGNTMTATTLAANRFLGELRQQQQDVESLLALGATSREAASEVVREALRAALIPSIAGMMIVGIAALPGMMTGQVLAGQDPAQAVRYQIVVQYMIMFSAVATSLMIVRLLHRRYFTPDHQLEVAVIRQVPRRGPDNSLVARVNRFLRGSS